MNFNLNWILYVNVIYIFHISDSRCMKHYILLNSTDMNECDLNQKYAESAPSNFNSEKVEITINPTPTEIEDSSDKTVLKFETFTDPPVQEIKDTSETTLVEIEFLYEDDKKTEETTYPTFENGIMTSSSFEEIEDTSDPYLDEYEISTAVTTKSIEYEPYTTFAAYEFYYDVDMAEQEAVTTIIEFDFSHSNGNDNINRNTNTTETDKLLLKLDMNKLLTSFAKNTLNVILGPGHSKANSTKDLGNSSIELTTVSALNNKTVDQTNNAEMTDTLKEVAVVVACAALGSLFVLYVTYRLRNCVHRDYNLPDSHLADSTV